MPITEENRLIEIINWIEIWQDQPAYVLNNLINDILKGKNVRPALIDDDQQAAEMFEAAMPNFMKLLEYYEDLPKDKRPMQLHFSFTETAKLEQAAKEILRMNKAIEDGSGDFELRPDSDLEDKD